MKYGTLHLSSSGSPIDLAIEQPSAVVGRAEGSAIQIDHPTVARRHARLTIEGGHLSVEDLGSATGVYVDGNRIPAGTPVRVEPSQTIRFGDVQATFTTAGSGPSPAGAPPLVETREPLSRPRLSVTLSPAAVAVEPGTEAVIEARITNHSPVIDSISLETEGLPAAWLTETGSSLNLRPGQEGTARIVIAPPRSPEATAGDHNLTVIARSQATASSPRSSAVVTISPFAQTTSQLQRRRGHFALSIANLGNSAASFNLDASDDEGVLHYEFSSPAVTVPSQGKETVDLVVSRPGRQLFGPRQTVPFRVSAKRTDMEVAADELVAEYRRNAALERYKWPGLILFALLLLLGLAGIAWALQRGGGDRTRATAGETPSASPTATAPPVEAVIPNPCDDQSLAAEVVPASAAGTDELFTQKDARWGAVVYARADDPVDVCGTTIGQCGCALTSAVNVLRILGNTTMPDGRAVTPQTVNEYFNRDARRAGNGWQSRGYYHNGINWFAVTELSADIAHTNPGTSRIVFVPQWGSGGVQEIKDEVSHGRPVILELYIRSARYTGPHFVTAVGLDGDRVVVKDPSYDEPRYLEPYLSYIMSSRLFRYADDGPAVEGVAVTVASNERIRIVDKDGRVIGTFEGDTPEEAIEKARREIPDAIITYQPAWRDATCTRQPSEDDGGTIEIFVPGAGPLQVEPMGSGLQGCTVMVTHVAADGTVRRELFEDPDCRPFGLNTEETFTITLTKAGDGDGSPTGGGTYEAGTVAFISPNPTAGSVFEGWTGPDAAECATGSVTMDADKSCTATYKTVPTTTQLYSLTLNRAGTGTGSLSGAGNYQTGRVATVSAIPARGSWLSGWGGPNGAECATGRVTMNADKSCTATFALASFTLTLTKAGPGDGSVLGGGTYGFGTAVNVGATPADGSIFAGWSGPDGPECGTGNVAMDADKSCVATFDLEPAQILYTLTMSINEASTGGGELFPTAGPHDYPAGTRVEIKWQPDAVSTFSTFFGPNATECRTGIVVMNGDKQCDAIFTIPFVSSSKLSCARSQRIQCDLEIKGDYNRLRWFMNGLPINGATGLAIDEAIPTGSGDGTVLTVSVEICNVLPPHSACKSQSLRGTVRIVESTPVFEPP